MGLKKLRDFLRGDIPTLDDSECIFPNVPLEHKVKEKEEVVRADADEEESSSSTSAAHKELTLEQIQVQTDLRGCKTKKLKCSLCFL